MVNFPSIFDALDNLGIKYYSNKKFFRMSWKGADITYDVQTFYRNSDDVVLEEILNMFNEKFKNNDEYISTTDELILEEIKERLNKIRNIQISNSEEITLKSKKENIRKKLIDLRYIS